MSLNNPSSQGETWMLRLLDHIASGLQPNLRSHSDRYAMYFMKMWGLVRTKPKSNKWEVTSAGYQWLLSERGQSVKAAKVEDVTNKLKKLVRHMNQLGRHAEQCEYEVANLVGAYTLLMNRLNDIGDRHLIEDRQRAGYKDPAP